MTTFPEMQSVMMLGIVLVRIAAAFALAPVFAPTVMPPTVRNSTFVGLALIVLIWRPIDVSTLSMTEWMALFGRELFIGLTIGFFMSGALWALQTAGGFIDRKIGPSLGSIADPLSGEETAINGAFFARLGNFAFVASGGLLLLVGAILKSYVLAPISPSAPHLQLGDARVFETSFQNVMALSVAFAAPALFILTLAEAGMGLINRFAPQLNVFSASLSIKSWLATLVILITSSMMIQALINDTARRGASVIQSLPGLSGPQSAADVGPERHRVDEGAAAFSAARSLGSETQSKR